MVSLLATTIKKNKMNMKKILLTIVFAVLAFAVFSQVTNTFGYQAVVRAGTGELVQSKPITLRASILQGNAFGTAVYTELHRPVTDETGLVSIEVGRGETQDDFSQIDWSQWPYFIRIEIDPLGGENYSIDAVNQLVAVPYALYAEKAGSLDTLGGYNISLSNVLANGNDAGGNRITNLSAPSDSDNAATKHYVDSLTAMLNEGNLFIDRRDNNMYSYVKIGNQLWMSENLRYAGNIPLDTIGGENTEIAHIYYPNGSEENLFTYGLLYNWTAIMDGMESSDENPSNVQGICPNGWYLPSRTEWSQLAEFLGANGASQLAGNSNLWNDGAMEQSAQFGTSGFGALPAGSMGTESVEIGNYAGFWSATDDGNDAYTYGINYSSTDFAVETKGKAVALSVRCVCSSVIATLPAFDILKNRATLHCKLKGIGIPQISEYGFVYGVDAENLTEIIQANTDFVAKIVNLNPATIYYYKSYAKVGNDTMYGEVRSFKTNGQFVDDRDGTVYEMVDIGEQTWMAENLRYLGDIPFGSNGLYSNDSAYHYVPDNFGVNTYGYLYNWPAAINGETGSVSNPSGVQGICPNGWHLPSQAEWLQLVAFVGEGEAASKLAGRIDLWIDGELKDNPHFGTTGFNALPAGSGYGTGDATYFWSASYYQETSIYTILMDYGTPRIYGRANTRQNKFSIRCVRND